ncbi:synembryn-A [Halyomorpha halys]|uniref:synembryn-A n=1 Tax=Halyomorpha halys TaxID=286706 RepID=UPI0006D4D65E|nr:synembryn-A [Halyomorpha halys]
MDKLISSLENLTVESSIPLLSTFVEENEKNFCSPCLDVKIRERFWVVLFKQLEHNDPAVKLLCLKAIRILSREKLNLDKFINEKRLQVLFNLSNINLDLKGNDECSMEALKSLCNLTYNFPSGADVLHSFGATLLLAKKLQSLAEENFERTLSEIKLLFLITGFYNSSRDLLFKNYGLNFFTELCMKIGNISDESLLSSSSKKPQLNANQMKLLCETLKITFNVLCDVKGENSNKVEFKKFVALLREMILVGLSPQTINLINNIVNLLTIMPHDCLSALIIPGKQVNDKKFIEKSPAMEAVSILIDFLDAILTKLEDIPSTPKEELSPVTLLLTNMSKSNPFFRRYIKSKVLPNLRDVYTRPEVGNTLRNKLCRLLTCPITSTKRLVADFLFVLCKESVARMVKYTGYGNAAGLLANRGLLGGNPISGSDSEDSETEEYTQNKHMINPVVGCLTPPRVNEIANMTEEQKEYFALELVNKIDKLQREGIIKPCRVGPDGKPVPVEHVLELQDNASFEPSKNK